MKKKCRTCGKILGRTEFSKDGKDEKGRQKFKSSCKKCMGIKYSQWREANLDYNKKRCKEWRKHNKEKQREYNIANRHKILATTRERQLRIKQQTPELSKVEKFMIEGLYLIARILSDTCNEPYEIDHILPVSKGGLHTYRNLQILTRKENRSKANKVMRI